MAEVARQRAVIARIQPKQAQDIAAVAQWAGKTQDPGNAAYYSFHAAWDAPAPLAFVALGLRDVAPYILRVLPWVWRRSYTMARRSIPNWLSPVASISPSCSSIWRLCS
jgi:hypothetical protein